ncbi:hypothetical protein DL771_012358 [Monosporascus sp. 5C6A]|nr:hypothetical protein DL771_012358 [Monosporascus sp. 5C6A]
MNNTVAYTPLESLFLFQLLAKYGFINGAFNRISDELKSTPLIREQQTYDVVRLSPDALQELALQLLREEQRQDAEAADKNWGGLSPNSRKRKLQSPPLPTLEEAHKYADRLPILVDRLYARFRESIVRGIREDEQRIEALQREIGEIERGEWDNRVNSRPESQAASKAAPTTIGDANVVKTNGQAQATPPPIPPPPRPHDLGKTVEPTRTPTPAPAPAPAPIPTPATHPQADRRPTQPTASPLTPAVHPPSEVHQITQDRRAQEPVHPPTGTSPVLQHPQAVQSYSPRPTSVTPQPPITESLQRPENPAQGRSPAPSHVVPSQASQAQTSALKWEPPYQPNQYQHSQYQHNSLPSPRPPYNVGPTRPPNYPPPPAGHQQSQAYAGGKQTPTQFAQPSRASPQIQSQPSPPVLLPPQNTGQLPPSLPSLPLNATPDGAGQQAPQYRPPSVPTPGPKPSGAPPSSVTQPSAPTAPVQTPVRPSSAVPTPAAQPLGSATKGPVPAAPWPVATNSPRAPYTPQAPVSHTPIQKQQQQSTPQPYTPTYNTSAQPPPTPRPEQQPQPPPAQTPVAAPQPVCPVSLPQTPLGLNVPSHVIRGHGTKWVSTPTPATPRVEELSGYFDTESPAYEPLSPPLRPVQLPKTSPNQSGKKEVPRIDMSTARFKAKQPRSAQKAGFALTQAEGPPTAPDFSGSRIKKEEATPRASDDGGDTDGDEGSQGRLRMPTTTANKRKREDSPIEREPPGPPTHVLWTRSFNKVSASALEQVISHRHANMFAHAVKEREAPGYRNIVLQPQDLNNIRRAINHGHRAAMATAATLPDLDQNAGSIWLPISVDLVPPRGIINIAQLEREIVHMFANAIMYAPDPNRGVGPSFLRERNDGSTDDNDDALGYEVDEDAIVKDTRSMFVEVEKLLSDLRNEVARNAPPPVGGPGSRSMSVVGGEVSTAEDEADEPSGDAKRRRVRVAILRGKINCARKVERTMAPQRVVADSDDEEDSFSPVRYPANTPEPEPLSPLHQASSPVDRPRDAAASRSHSNSNHISDETDPSFFATIYDDQQNRALQQSHLIENIVRQSQKASASSGDVSIPAKGEGENRANDASSGTEVTPPVVLSRPIDRQSTFSGAATQLTPPRKTVGGDMWDVPSSPADSSSIRSVESSRGKKKTLTTYGKRKRSNAGLTTGFAGTDMSGGGENDVQDQPEQAAAGAGAAAEPSALPASKKPKVSLYDTTSENSTTFYVAQSNLTTMQKLEYQKVQVPSNPYAGLTGTPANQKSSGVTTIAYSTPSFYASSGPPLPWERTPAVPQQIDTSEHVIDITSSPDVMASGHGRPKRRKSASASHAEEALADASNDALPALSETPASLKKRRKKAKDVEEVDELGHDDSWDSDAVGHHRETYRPRRSRRRSNAASIHEDETAQNEAAEAPVDIVEMDQAEGPPDTVQEDSAPDAQPAVPEISKAVEPELPLKAQPKKRGRKKKQPAIEEIPQDQQPAEEEAAVIEIDPPIQPAEVEEPVEKPKKKRGRPRKSDPAKAAEVAVPPAAAETQGEPEEQTRDIDNDEAPPEQVEDEPKSKKAAQRRTRKSNPDEDTAPEQEASVLKELDGNASSGSMSSEPASKKSSEGRAATENNHQPKAETARETPKSAASQSKVLYRVGLSKKTRIAPLLKSIRK